VFTGVAVVQTDHDDDCGMTWDSEVVDTQVTFRNLSDEMIDAYIATGEPFDKAGGYGIQGWASTFVEAIYGDYFNIVGLPIATVAKMLEEIGIAWWRGSAALE
jgi:septum formation protein